MSLIKNLKLDNIVALEPWFRGDFGQASYTDNGKPLTLKLSGELFFPPTENRHQDYGLNYSFGVRGPNQEGTILNTLQDKLKVPVSGDENDPQWQIPNPKVKQGDDGIFFRLKHNKELTLFNGLKTNVNLTPMNLSPPGTEKGSLVTVEFIPQGWYKKSTGQYGMNFKVLEIQFPNAGKRKAPMKSTETVQDQDDVS